MIHIFLMNHSSQNERALLRFFLIFKSLFYKKNHADKKFMEKKVYSKIFWKNNKEHSSSMSIYFQLLLLYILLSIARRKKCFFFIACLHSQPIFYFCFLKILKQQEKNKTGNLPSIFFLLSSLLLNNIAIQSLQLISVLLLIIRK